MEITTRALWTMIHGMGFGALYLLACSGAIVELYRFTNSTIPAEPAPGQERFLKIYLAAMAVIAWVAVLLGAYVIYPWYRATPPPGTTDLAMFPQRLLMSSTTTIDWHSHGMERARCLVRSHLDHDGRLRLHQVWSRPQEPSETSRCGVDLCCGFVCCSGIAGYFGAMIDKYAPVQGGHTIQLSQGDEK